MTDKFPVDSHEPTSSRLPVRFVKKGGWLGDALTSDSIKRELPIHQTIEERARLTNARGQRPLWEGYAAVSDYPRPTKGVRYPDEVRPAPVLGRFLSYLASSRRNPTILEFGTGFGVSGMFWLAGIGEGHLFTFEPNAAWADLASENLAAISPRFTLVVNTFEAAWSSYLSRSSVDIALIDAIHTCQFVRTQLAILRPLMKPGGLVLFDDIRFSEDMEQCWNSIAREPVLAASATVGRRIGIIELPLS
jgi:predicted O-methyltransferase YrrM